MEPDEYKFNSFKKMKVAEVLQRYKNLTALSLDANILGEINIDYEETDDDDDDDDDDE